MGDMAPKTPTSGPWRQPMDLYLTNIIFCTRTAWLVCSLAK